MTGPDLKSLIRRHAAELGFAGARVAPAGVVPEFHRFQRWLEAGLHAGMGYMARHLAVRRDSRRLLDGARSVICLAAGYAPGAGDKECLIARFARGADYHRVLKTRGRRLIQAIRRAEPSFGGRVFVDAGPIMERSLAAACGLGWIGDNGCLFVPGCGSYVVLCEVVCNLPLEADAPIQSRCTHCGRCRAACPTGALQADGLVDARRCRSYLTIEHPGRIDPEHWPAMAGTLFGCDDCQQACPHNQHPGPGDGELTDSGTYPAVPALADVLGWQEQDWDAFTRGRALRRLGYPGWLRNAILAAGAAKDLSAQQARALYLRLTQLRRQTGPAQQLRDELDWAIQRLHSGL